MIDLPGSTDTVTPDRWHTTSKAAASAAPAGCGLAEKRSRCSVPLGQAALACSTAASNGSGPQQ